MFPLVNCHMFFASKESFGESLLFLKFTLETDFEIEAWRNV